MKLLALVTSLATVAPLLSSPHIAAGSDEAVKLGQAAARAVRAAPGITFRFERRQFAADGSVAHTNAGHGAVSIGAQDRGVYAVLDGDAAKREAAGLDAAAREASSAPGVDSFALRVDGDAVRVLDPEAKTLWTSRMYRAGAILMDQYGQGSVGPFISPDTFANLELYEPRVTGREDVGGVACNVLAMALPDGAERRLYLGVADALPRRMSMPEDGGQVDITWTAVRVLDPPIEKPSAPALPAGWSEHEFTLGGPQPGQRAPEWTTVGLDGRPISLGDLRGKVVVLDFWATWCGPCVASMPSVQRLHDEYRERGLVVIGARWSDTADPAATLKRLGITYAIVDGAPFAGSYGVNRSGIPALFVIDREGRVVDYFVGYQGAETETRIASIVSAQFSAH